MPEPTRPRTPCPVERVETLTVGAGQAGLAMSGHLRRHGLRHPFW